MNAFDWNNTPAYYAEMGRDSLRVLGARGGLDLPLDRLPDRRLADACKTRVIQSLAGFLKGKPWQPRPRVVCAIGARGVSVRRLFLPPSSKEDLPRLLSLQVESEFPLPPEELAWGYAKLGDSKSDDPRPGQEVLVVAVRKETLDEYSSLLAPAGASPVFTLAALARSRLCPHPPADYSILDIGAQDSELVTFERNVPASLRTIAWGVGSPLSPSALPASGSAGLDLPSLLRRIEGHAMGRALYLTGHFPGLEELASRLAKLLANGIRCEAVRIPSGAGHSAATLGLRQSVELGDACPPIILHADHAPAADPSRPAPIQWAAVAAALLLAVLSFPYLEALLFKPHLARKLQAITAEKGRLVDIDRELDFLRYLKQNQPDYVDAIFLLSKAAQPGARFDSLSLNQRGDLSLHGPMANAQQVGEFRAKLIDSGVFTNVAIEEQAPSPDHQRVIIRLSARWKQSIPEQALAAEPGGNDKNKEPSKPGAKDNPKAAPALAPPAPSAPEPALPSPGPAATPSKPSPPTKNSKD